jgi:hypothetical protein
MDERAPAAPAVSTPDPAAPSATLTAAWREQKRWSRGADRAKRRYLRWSGGVVAMSIAAAAAATLASQVDWSPAQRAASFASAFLMAVVALVGRAKTSPEKLREWLRARSASEGLKSEVYLFVTRCGPYREDEPHLKLSDRVAAIMDATRDLTTAVADIQPADSKPPPDPMTLESYLHDRVKSQIDEYYRKKAAQEARRVSAYRSAEFGLAILGVVLGIWSGTDEHGTFLAPWAAVVTTAIAALAAHLAAGRHEYQVATYTATALQLERLSARFEDRHRHRPTTLQEIDELVTECEAAISVENQGWMTQWEKPAPAPGLSAGTPSSGGR